MIGLSVIGSLALLLTLPSTALAAPAGDPVVALVRGPAGLRVTTLDTEQRTLWLGAGEHVALTEPPVSFELAGDEAADPLLARQWGLAQIDASRAWEGSEGGDQVLAVVDTGVDGAHPDLEGALVPGWSADGTAPDTDAIGHGTHVAGIAVARAGNAEGGAGVAPGASIMPIRVVGEDGTASSAGVAQGILWAVEHGADVINVSLVGETRSTVVDAAIDEALAHDVVIVAAAGNHRQHGNPTIYPGAHPGVVAVAATRSTGVSASFSSTGDWIDIAAPGAGILSAAPGAAYDVASGTSMAAPHVAGTALLLRAAGPDLTAEEVVATLLTTARDLGPEGWDEESGAGLVDAGAAVGTVVDLPQPSAPDEPAESPDTGSSEGEAHPLERVGEDADPVAVALAVSGAVFGDGTATRAVLSRSDVFADSLAAAPLAGLDGPILFTGSAALDARTAAELRRVLPRGATVYLVGAEAALSAEIGDAVRQAGFRVRRLAGATRVESAIAVAEEISAAPERVLLARADTWVDALTGGAYAAAAGVPVLLIGAEPNPAVEAYLDRVQAQLVVLGGDAAIPDAVLAGRPAVRVAGPNRAATATAVAHQLWGLDPNLDHVPAVLLVDGVGDASWAPALAAAPLAAVLGAPQLLTDLSAPEGLPSDTRAFIAASQPDRVVAVGAGVPTQALEWSASNGA